MPFANATDGTPPVTMFQLTYNCPEEEALALARRPSTEILDAITAKCQHWHDPVPGMLEKMDPTEIWARPLYDRDPMPPPKKGTRSLVTLLGDAAHPMSPFKGQGANTALFDAAHLADKLATLPVTSALAVYEREMVARSSKRQLKSREARGLLHGPAVFEDSAFGIAGVRFFLLLLLLSLFPVLWFVDDTQRQPVCPRGPCGTSLFSCTRAGWLRAAPTYCTAPIFARQRK